MAPAPELEVLAPLYAAVTGSEAIVDLLGIFEEGPAVHTRRPVPDDALFPMLTIGPMIARTDSDGVNYYHSLVTVDVIAYGLQPDDYRKVEELGGLVYSLFHRQPYSITVPNWTLTDIRCSGPAPAPTDDDNEVGRAVTLEIRLSAQA